MGKGMQTASIDWAAVTEEATGILRDYIRIDTTNPPGNEEAGALFLQGILERDGIPSRLHDAGEGRVSISARLEGTGGDGLRPICLLSHIDVVPVEREHWTRDPFGGELIDGVIWGRGTLDMKGMGVMELMVMLLAKRHGLTLGRDLVFVAVADEEAGGSKGVHHLLETAPELFDADFVFNEGAYGFSSFMGKPTKLFGLGLSEKSPCWLRLRAKGRPGHASVPHDDNAVVKLVAALGRIEARAATPRLTSEVGAMIATLKERGFFDADFDAADTENLVAMGSVDPYIRAITTDTVNVTGLRAGKKHNVIPAGAEATLDCRLLPDTDPDRFVAEIEAVIDDDDVVVERVLEHVSGRSSVDTLAVAVMSDVIRERYGDEGGLMPMLSPGFTDSHAYRKSGGEAYGFIPALVEREELATIHGHDERISQANLRLGTEILFEVVTRLAMRPGR
ncbi:MAG: M20/M25/M40 family metallo-hydrolase [Deltaproteobacteria bacterium]